MGGTKGKNLKTPEICQKGTEAIKPGPTMIRPFNLRGNRGKCYSGPHPVMVSGLGIRPNSQLQIAFPWRLVVHTVPGPHGLGRHGLARKLIWEKIFNLFVTSKKRNHEFKNLKCGKLSFKAFRIKKQA